MTQAVAAELLKQEKQPSAPRQARKTSAGSAGMNKEFQVRFSAVLLALATAAAMIFAWINFQKEREFAVPSDGVWWVEKGDALVAERVDPTGPGAKAGIKVGDELTAVAGQSANRTAALTRQLYRAGIYSKVTYSLTRHSVPLETSVILVPVDKSLNAGMRLIALIYLGIGLYVLLRRWTAPKATHFYVFCLVSFVFYAFHYTGKLNEFDWIIYWSNVVAWLLQPALFLHFALTFPDEKPFVKRHRWTLAAIYAIPALLLAIHSSAVAYLEATESLLWQLDRSQMLYLTAYFIVAAAVLWKSYRRSTTPIRRQQMKWVTRGTILSIAPFTVF